MDVLKILTNIFEVAATIRFPRLRFVILRPMTDTWSVKRCIIVELRILTINLIVNY